MQIQSAIRAQLIPIWMGIINKFLKNTGGEGLGQKQSLEGDEEMKLVKVLTNNRMQVPLKENMRNLWSRSPTPKGISEEDSRKEHAS